jgi:hypothetical protein
MNEKLTYHFQKTIRVISSCETEEHLLAAKNMMINFVYYWGDKIESKTLTSYIKYLNILFKHQRDKVLDYEQ